MHNILAIQTIRGREVLDSRGNPTVEAEIVLQGGAMGRAIVPSGASTGQFEAHERRDQTVRYAGKGVRDAVDSIHHEIAPMLIGWQADQQCEIDLAMQTLDGTENKSRLGANAILAVSLAVSKAAAQGVGLPLYRYVGGGFAHRLPVPMLNMLNGGAHADNPLDIQEFMVAPVGASSFSEAMEMAHAITHHLRARLKKDGLSTNLGDEGGFAPHLNSAEDAIERLVAAIEAAGLRPGDDARLALDCASSEYYADGIYTMAGEGLRMDSTEHVAYLQTLAERYPIYSIEDGMAEDDWQGWAALTAAIGDRVQLVGDDLFVTNPARLSRGIAEKSANALLVKVNQIGTLTEACAAVEMAHRAGLRCVMSHRSGEAEDVTISDLAVALNCGQIKTGALARGERTAKYNQLLRIEQELGKVAQYGI